MVNGDPYSKEVDIWALGCFAFELASGGKSPFFEEAKESSLRKNILEMATPRLNKKWSSEFQAFVDACLQKNMQCRPTIEQVLDHPLLRNGEALRAEWVTYVENLLADEEDEDCE